MTAVGTERDTQAGGDDAVASPAEAAGSAAGPGGPAPRRSLHTRVAAAVVVVCVLVGMAAGLGAALLAGGRYESTATVVFTSAEFGTGDDDVSAGSRSVQARLSSYAQIASSDAVANRAVAIARATGRAPFDPTAVSITAKPRSGTEIVEVTAASDDRATVASDASSAAQALVDVVVGSERYPGLPRSRVAGDVATPGTAAVDHGLSEGEWWSVLGGVAGFLLSLTACALLRPGPWARDVARQPVRNRRRAVELNAALLGDELRAIVSSVHTPAGRISVIVAVLAVAGYGATGLFVFPLLVVLGAALQGWRTKDARWSAAALLFVGVSVFPEKVDIVKLGPVTPTVLEAALVIALIMLVRANATAPRAAFTAPVYGIVIAAAVGSVVALARGGDFGMMIDNARAIMIVLAFFPIYLSFARRPHQLVATLMLIGGAASSVVIVASFAGWSRLLVDQRGTVITGDTTDNVSRLSSPVLSLWAPLLILVLSALMPRRPRWLWLALVVVGVAHEALSFNRSTWAPLILLVIAVAAVTHGPRGLIRRLLALILVGVVGFALAFGGVLGAEGKAIADRASSVVTGQAYGEDSLPDRLRENGAAIVTLGQSPWVGVGMGQYYGGELVTYDSEHNRTVVDPRPYIHNQYLRMWLYMGVLGLFAYGFAGVRIVSLTFHSWRRRAAGAPMVVGLAMGLACLAAQASLQTTLVDRPTILTTVALMAAAAAFATWSPRPPGSAPPPGVPAGAVPAPAGPPPAHRPPAASSPPPDGSLFAVDPTRPAARAGTLEE